MFRIFLQETYEVIDAKYYNDGSTTTGLTAQSGVSLTSDGEYVSYNQGIIMP